MDFPEGTLPTESEELASENLNLVTLNEVSADQLPRLRESIAKNGGTIHIIVHPFYVSGASEEMFPTPVEFQNRRDDFLKQEIEEGKPLIVFEEASRLSALKSRLKTSKGTLHVVTTTHDNPLPVSVEEYKKGTFNQGDKTRWDPLINLFKNLGVNHALVGGRYMNLDQPFLGTEKVMLEELKGKSESLVHARDFLEKGILPTGCPGVVIQQLLRAGIDVSISPISHPDNRI